MRWYGIRQRVVQVGFDVRLVQCSFYEGSGQVMCILYFVTCRILVPVLEYLSVRRIFLLNLYCEGLLGWFIMLWLCRIGFVHVGRWYQCPVASMFPELSGIDERTSG